MKDHTNPPDATLTPTGASSVDVHPGPSAPMHDAKIRSPLARERDARATDEVVTVLNELIETSRDGEKGFALAARDSKEATLTTLFREGEQSFRSAVAELQDQVQRLGAKPDTDGSMKAAVHRGWISLKSAVTSLDSKAILEECERGQDYAKAKYAEALNYELPEELRMLIERQHRDVIERHDQVRDLRNQYLV